MLNVQLIDQFFSQINGYECLCPPDYTGAHCDVKQSSCDSSKCASGSQCVNSPDGHECVCPDGYEGQFCETKINVRQKRQKKAVW